MVVERVHREAFVNSTHHPHTKVTRIELVATGARGSDGLYPWRHRVRATERGDESRLRAHRAFDPELHELADAVNTQWIVLDGARDERDVGSIFAAICDQCHRRAPDEGDDPRAGLEAPLDPRSLLSAIAAEGDDACSMVGGVRIFAEDREVVPVPCCTDAESWAGWRAPLSTAPFWRPESGHDPRLDVAVTANTVEIELCYDDANANATRDWVTLDRASFEAAIARADADVAAFAALAERWLAKRCAPEDHARIAAWMRKAVGLEPR